MRATRTLTEGRHVRQLGPGDCDAAELAREARAPGAPVFVRAEFAGRTAACLLTGERYLHLPEATG